MRKEENKFIPLNLSSRISEDNGSPEDFANQSEVTIDATDFIYYELENEWLQEYELIYNSYRLEN